MSLVGVESARGAGSCGRGRRVGFLCGAAGPLRTLSLLAGEAVIAMMWGYGGGWGWGAWLAVGFGMVVFWGVVIAGALALVHYIAGGRRGGSSDTVDVSGAEQVLAERFARGEIDEAEYRRRSALLRGGR